MITGLILDLLLLEAAAPGDHNAANLDGGWSRRAAGIEELDAFRRTPVSAIAPAYV
jgi:hypothetical protein